MIISFGRSQTLQATACTAEALIHLLFNMSDTSRNQAKMDFALRFLKKLCLHLLGRLNDEGGGQLTLGENASLALTPDGRCDLTRVVRHAQISAALKSTWEKVGGLSEYRDAALLDVVHFVAVSRRTRRLSGQRAFTPRAAELCLQLQCGLAKLLSRCLNQTVQRIIDTTPDIESRQIPSRKKRRASSCEQLVLQAGEQRPRRGQVQVDVDSIWELIQEAQDTGVSLPVLARTKKSERQGGCSEHTVKYWLHKLLSMYSARACLAFEGVRFYNLVTDSSTFSTRDTCVSVLYSCERDMGCHLAHQAVKGNFIAPAELYLDASVERMVAIRKADRVASYRLLQALSNQLSQLSNRKVNISAFQISDGTESDVEQHSLTMALTPLTPNHLRVVNRFPDGSFRSVEVFDKRRLVEWVDKRKKYVLHSFLTKRVSVKKVALTCFLNKCQVGGQMSQRRSAWWTLMM